MDDEAVMVALCGEHITNEFEVNVTVGSGVTSTVAEIADEQLPL